MARNLVYVVQNDALHAIMLANGFHRLSDAFAQSVVQNEVKLCAQVAGGHITEYDCLCGYEHMVLAISCKAFLNCTREKLLLKIKDPLSEVVSFAASVERFGLPVLCVLDKFNLPTILTESKTKAKVAIIDIKDLAEPEKLVTIFKERDEEYKVSAEGSTEQDQPL